jgi:peptide/nickel transport system substrate-binding protein
MRNIRKLDGTLGGTIRIAISEEPDTFNIYVTNSAYSAAILSELYPSLYKYGPDLTPWPDLAENLLTETHTDNPSVPVGHTRFTIDIVHNATWSDGEPLTAEDVAFTFTYAHESGIYGNPAWESIGEMIAVYAPSTFRVVIEFSTSTYWHFSNFAYTSIIPKHIFNDIDGIGYEEWNTWNPVYDPAEPHVTCGPFVFTDYDAGEYYTITKNPLFHYSVQVPTSTTTITTATTTSSNSTTTTTGQTNESTQQQIELSRVLSTALITGSGIVIVFCIVLIVRER